MRQFYLLCDGALFLLLDILLFEQSNWFTDQIRDNPESILIQNRSSHESIRREKNDGQKESLIYLRSLCTPASSRKEKCPFRVPLKSEKSTDVQWGVRNYPSSSFFKRGREGARYCVCILRGNRRSYRRRRYAVYSSGVIPGKIWRRCSLLFSRKKDGHTKG